MNAIVKYLQDTRAELRHVAWPTQMQTIVYTVIVILLSIFVALYLGLFDYIFTTSLSRGLSALPESATQIQVEQPANAGVDFGNLQVETTAPSDSIKVETTPAEGSFKIPTE